MQNIIKQGYRIIIVDNGSKDNIEDVLDANFKSSNIELIKLQYNIGFGRANNLALERVKTKYAFLLNPDAIIMPNSIDLMLEIAEQNQNIALLNPIFVKDISLLHYVNKNKKIEKAYTKAEFISGGAMFMNMNIFRDIGFFDMNIFLYHEDSQISSLALNNGLKIFSQIILLCKSAICVNLEPFIKVLFKRHYHLGWSYSYVEKVTKYF